MAKGKDIPLMKGMPNRHSKMWNEHWEKDMSAMGEESDLRYTDKPNPEALHESQVKLADYAKKHKMNY